jgi:hypothetical protein
MGGPHARERHVNSGEPPTKVASTAVIGVAMQSAVGTRRRDCAHQG